MPLKTAAIIYGGKSTEHEISIRSARNIFKAIDYQQYNPLLIAIAKDGKWYLKTKQELESEVVVQPNGNQLVLIPGASADKISILVTNKSIGRIDVVFPIVHGTGGEDGSLQGILKTLNIAFVGPGIIGSALCIDKDVAKRILTESGIANSKFLSFRKSERDQISYEKAQTILGLPLYIKPPNLGSSVGISKVTTKSEFSNAIELALSFDRKVLIEENIVGREIECAVIGNNDVHASPVGEVVTIGENHTFYSYEAKYTDANGSVTVIPAEMDSTTQDRIRDIAIKTYKALNCEGMARVDVFLKDNGDIIVNEVNSLPGFTDISMYPQLWEAGGVSYTELISKLLALAIERNIEDNKMLTSIE
ncbi:D-alanine--D-alanine ligase [Bacteroidia bacterium]|nr:D-alanine--D-alanine ligase [Bacteroidia bacterium]MDB9882997.1 D-alanine--D-alanine ligase [Bacteroidia bacterium]